ncbi:MAG TPA: hypothetical protein VFF82_04545 [Rhodocyclaceae bacterium]|nr:hypothetical protein [Rhodocyclaceae bacterium]
MLTTLLTAIGFIFAVTIGGIVVERIYRRFARNNPKLGPFRKEGKQDCCSCTAGSGCDPNTSSCHLG